MASLSSYFFFFNDTATTEIYTLSLHDALPISSMQLIDARDGLSLETHHHISLAQARSLRGTVWLHANDKNRSEEHTSELQSLRHLVCRLLLEKKKNRRPARRSGSLRRVAAAAT